MQLKKRISEMSPGDKLASEAMIAREFGVAKMTAARSLDLLEKWSMVKRISGRGTFVTSHSPRIIKVVSPPSFCIDLLKTLLPKKFPEIELQNSRDNDSPIIKAVTSISVEYASLLAPFPKDMLIRLRKNNSLFPFVFNVHSEHGLTYGIPAFFSPILIAWNRKLMNKIDPDFNPLALTPHLLYKLCKEAHDHGLDGFSGDFFRIYVSNAMICAAKTSYDISGIRQALDLTMPLLDFYNQENTFLDGKALFCFIPRYKLPSLIKHRISFELAPFPAFFGFRETPVVTESFCVNRNAADKELLFNICEYTLSAEFQEELGKNFSGLPTDRTAIFNSMEIRPYHDNFFFSGLSKISMINNTFPPAFNRRFYALSTQLRMAQITPETFRNELLETYRIAMRDFMNERKQLNDIYNIMQH